MTALWTFFHPRRAAGHYKFAIIEHDCATRAHTSLMSRMCWSDQQREFEYQNLLARMQVAEAMRDTILESYKTVLLNSPPPVLIVKDDPSTFAANPQGDKPNAKSQEGA